MRGRSRSLPEGRYFLTDCPVATRPRRRFSGSLEDVGERFRGHSALILGLGSLLAIMAVAGIGALRVLENVRNRDEQIRRQFLSRNHVLNGIRSEVYLS